MNYWIIIIVVGFIIVKTGFWGGLITFMLAMFIFSSAKQKKFSSQSRNQNLFFLTTFEVLGHISKAKGKITQTDIDVALSVMDMMNLQEQTRVIAQRAFSRGKDANYPLDEKIQTFYQRYANHPDLINLFFEIQLQSVFSDNVLHPKEQKILENIAQELRFSQAKFEQFIKMAQRNAHFAGQNGVYRTSLNDAYNILNVKESDDTQTIKRAYRKLMNQNHPDKLVSKGLPPEMLDIAKRKAQEIQAAYDAIKQERGFS